MNAKLGWKGGPFRQVAHADPHAKGIQEEIPSPDGSRAGCGWNQAREHPQSGRFPRPIGPQEAQNLPWEHIKAQIPDRCQGPEVFAQILGRNQGVPSSWKA